MYREKIVGRKRETQKEKSNRVIQIFSTSYNNMSSNISETELWRQIGVAGFAVAFTTFVTTGSIQTTLLVGGAHAVAHYYADHYSKLPVLPKR